MGFNKTKEWLYCKKVHTKKKITHLVLILFTLTFIQGHTDLNHENNKCFILNNAHPVCCEASPSKHLYDHRQYDDLALHQRSQLHLKLDNCFK